LAERSAEARRWDRVTLTCLVALAAALPLILWIAALVVRWRPYRAGLSPIQAELTPGVLAVSGLVAAGVAGLLLSRLRRSLRDGDVAWLSVPWVITSFLLLFLTLEIAVQPLIDPVKRMSDLTAAISRVMPGHDPVPAYLPLKFSPESVYGMISFDLGRRTLPLRTPDQLRTFVEQEPGARVVLRANEASALPSDLLGRLVILYDERGRKASPFIIAGWVRATRR